MLAGAAGQVVYSAVRFVRFIAFVSNDFIESLIHNFRQTNIKLAYFKRKEISN